MELRQLEYVLAAIDLGGFTRAAEALHVAQPTLSRGSTPSSWSSASICSIASGVASARRPRGGRWSLPPVAPCVRQMPRGSLPQRCGGSTPGS